MSAVTEVQHFLDRYRPAIVVKARELAEGKCVRIEGLSARQIDAEVVFEEEDEDVAVSLVKVGDQWQPASEPENEMEEIALCAALLGAEHKLIAGVAEAPAQEQTLQEMVEKRLSRQITSSEEQFLAKIEKRWQRFRSGGEIFDHDMVRINTRWPIRHYDPLALWPTPPPDVWEFCRYILAALAEQKLQVPAFLESIADLEKVRRSLSRWRQDKMLPQWTHRIRDFLDDRVPVAMTGELRLLITFDEARLQYRAVETEPWRLITDESLAQLLQAERSAAFLLPVASRSVVASGAHSLGEAFQPIMRLEDVPVAQWLASLFQQREMSELLVTLDENPFAWSEQPLKWHIEEVVSKNGVDRFARLSFVSADGQPLGISLRYLGGTQSLYLSADTVYVGAPYFGGSTLAPPFVDVPMAALCNEDGVTFLEKLGLAPPPTLQEQIKRESFRVNITARCLPKADPAGTEHVTLEVEATSTNGAIRQRMGAGTWEVEDYHPTDRGQVICYDRAPLAEAAEIVERLRGTFDPDLNAYRVRVTRAFPEQFHEWALSLPEHFSLKPDTNLQTILADPLKATVRFEINEKAIDWFDLRMIFEVEGLDLKPAEIRNLINAKGGFVRLADGSWRSVRLELTEAQQQMIDGLGIDLDEIDEQAHAIHLRQIAQQKQKEIIPPELWERIRGRLRKLDLETKPPVPEGLQITLRPYQIEGYHFLAYLSTNRLGGILADDMGLGKTLQSISWVLWLRSNIKKQPGPLTLIVCPKSVLDVWAVEFQKAAPSLRVRVLREKDDLDLRAVREEYHVLVINYAQLRVCIDELAKIELLSVILDEGQQIKNPDSKVAKAARQLNAQNRLVLSGTPLENRLLDLWSLMTFATPGALGDRAYFQKHFDRRKDERAAERLSSRMKPFLLRRTKGQVARELPPRSEEAILCEMSGLQEKLYRDYLAKAQHMVLTTSGVELFRKRRFAVLQALTRLRQICCHPALVQPGAEAEESAKLNALLDLLDQLHEEGHKVLVFSQFVTMLNIIRDRLTALQRPWHYLSGATQNRADVVNRFQNDSDASVFLLSLKAGGSGLNLTAASYVVLYDPWWNPAVENQAIDRAHRIGQTQPVMAYRLLAKDTIEEKIQRLQAVKNLMSTDVLGDAGFSRALEMEDLEYLFELKTEPDA